MKTHALARLYDRLEPDERFRLVVQALARGDRAEADRLGRACPVKRYAISDPRYADRLELSDELTLVVLLELVPKLTKLRMVEVFRMLSDFLGELDEHTAMLAYVEGLEAGWRAAGGEGERPPEAMAEGALDRLVARGADVRAHYQRMCDGLAAELAADARPARDGFAAFCRDELGLEPEALIAAWMRPALALLEEHRAALDAAECDPEARDALATVLGVAWRRRALGDSTAEVDPDLRERLAGADGL